MEKSVRLIIDIPRKTVEHIRSDYGHGYTSLYLEDSAIICDAIYKGIPYKEPKHGYCKTCNERYEDKGGFCHVFNTFPDDDFYCGHYMPRKEGDEK